MTTKMIDRLLTLATSIRSELKTIEDFTKECGRLGLSDPVNSARLHFLDGQLELIEKLLQESQPYALKPLAIKYQQGLTRKE